MNRFLRHWRERDHSAGRRQRRAADDRDGVDKARTASDDSSVISLFDIAYAGRVDLAERYIDEYRSQINDVEAGTGLSPLHIAIGRNHLQLVKFLLEQG